MQRMLIGWFGVALGASCHAAPTIAVDASPPVASEAPAPSPTKPVTRRPAETTPEIIAKATELLWANDSASIGTEFPFDMNGRRYVARIEMHDNPDGDPGRPQGEHKGMTVYVMDE
jgi:hypothetical protein